GAPPSHGATLVTLRAAGQSMTTAGAAARGAPPASDRHGFPACHRCTPTPPRYAMSRQSPRCIRFALPLALLTLSVVSSAADAQQSTGRRILAPTTAKSGAQPVAGAQEATGAQSATSAQAASNSASPASGCDFETADGFSLPFETCRAGNASGA